ncbi:MAG: hypothetical protein ACREF9_09250, partial [Opitutaceae bacterium]
IFHWQNCPSGRSSRGSNAHCSMLNEKCPMDKNPIEPCACFIARTFAKIDNTPGRGTLTFANLR